MLLPALMDDQMPESWSEIDRESGARVVFADDDDNYMIFLVRKQSQDYTVKLEAQPSNPAFDEYTEIGLTAAVEAEIALATAVGFMEMAPRLEQSYLS